MKQQLKKMFINQRWILLMLCLFGFLFHLVFTAILATAEIRTFANSFYQLIPPVFRSMAGFGDSANLMSSRLIAFGYNHPASLLTLMFIPLSTASRYISSEIENRTVDILLTRLFPRHRLLTSTLVFIVFSLLALYLSMVSGTFTGRLLFSLQNEFSMISIIRIFIIGLLFFTAVATVVLFIAVHYPERGKTISISAGLLLFLYVVDAIARIWDRAAFLQNISFFNLYRPGAIAGGGYDFAGSIFLLILIASAMFAAALFRFHRLDL